VSCRPFALGVLSVVLFHLPEGSGDAGCRYLQLDEVIAARPHLVAQRGIAEIGEVAACCRSFGPSVENFSPDRD
jgi:hypothetical protein